MRRPIAFLLLLVVAPVAPAESLSIDGVQSLDNVQQHLVRSEIVGRDYHVFVNLPRGYSESGSTKYPTLYVLDGGLLFPLFASYYNYLLSAGEIPEMIIVGVSYGTNDWGNGNDRSHDYTAPSEEREYYGGAAIFQKFLSDELLPMIEGEYRSKPDGRIIFGQSIGGQFVLFTAQTDPGLFWGHIASNPAIHRNLPFFLESHSDGSEAPYRSRLFVGSGSNDEPEFRVPALQWMKHWNSVDEIPWDLRTETLEGHSHFSLPPASFRSGLRWLFD